MDNNEKKQGFAGLFQSAVDTVKSKAQDIKLPDVKMPNVKLPEVKLPEIKLPKIQFGGGPKEQNPIENKGITTLSSKSIIKIIYYMMAVDGEITDDELKEFDEIGKEVDPQYSDLKEQIMEECRHQIEKVIDPEDYYSVLQDGIEDAIAQGANATGSVLTPKILIWDLLTIAHSDGFYHDKERQLMKYIVRKLDIDKAIFLEMESSYQTLIDLENELAWVKTTDRPYLTIETIVNEIADRKTVIFDSIKDLIAL